MKRIAILLCLATLASADGLWTGLSQEAEKAVSAASGALVSDRFGIDRGALILQLQGSYSVSFNNLRTGLRVEAKRPLVVFAREGADPRRTREAFWADGSRRKLTWIDGDDLLGVDVYEVEGELPACDRALPLDARLLRPGELVLALGDRGFEFCGLVRGPRAAAPFELDTRDDAQVLLGATGAVRALRLPPEPVPTMTPTWYFQQRIPLQGLVLPTLGQPPRVAAPAAGPRFLPATAILRAVRDVDEGGKIRKPYIGVVLGNHSDGAVIVTSVIPGSPAAKMGLRRGDRLAKIDGFPVTDADEATRIIRLQAPGSVVELTLAEPERGVTLILGDATDGAPRVVKPEEVGLHGIQLDPAFLDYLGLPAQTTGVLVKTVDEGSAAFAAGLRKGDVIIEADKTAIDGLDALRAAFAEASGKVALVWLRGGDRMSAAIGLPDPNAR